MDSSTKQENTRYLMIWIVTLKNEQKILNDMNSSTKQENRRYLMIWIVTLNKRIEDT